MSNTLHSSPGKRLNDGAWKRDGEIERKGLIKTK